MPLWSMALKIELRYRVDSLLESPFAPAGGKPQKKHASIAAANPGLLPEKGTSQLMSGPKKVLDSDAEVMCLVQTGGSCLRRVGARSADVWRIIN